MIRAAVEEKLRGFLQTKAPRPGLTLSAETKLQDEWMLNSLSVLETAAFIEDEFDVRVKPGDLNAATFASVASLADFVLSRTG